jgi:thioredoxin 1
MAGNVLEFTDANFAKEVDQGKGVCLVDFWAEWCAPCQMLAPKVKELADEYVTKARIGKLDTDAHRETAGRFGITAIPTLILFKDGEPVKRFVGMTAKDDLRAAIDEALGS